MGYHYRIKKLDDQHHFCGLWYNSDQEDASDAPVTSTLLYEAEVNGWDYPNV